MIRAGNLSVFLRRSPEKLAPNIKREKHALDISAYFSLLTSSLRLPNRSFLR
jgi:hypothetical protein